MRRLQVYNWINTGLHQIGDTIYVSTVGAINAALAAEPETELLGPFTADYAAVYTRCIRKTI